MIVAYYVHSPKVYGANDAGMHRSSISSSAWVVLKLLLQCEVLVNV